MCNGGIKASTQDQLNPAVVFLYPNLYSLHVNQILRSEAFNKWLVGLKDRQAIARIAARICSFELGNSGDCKPVKGGLGSG